MSYMDLGPRLIRQRNEEMLQEVQTLRLEERLRENRRACSGRSRTRNLTWRSALALLREAGI